LRSAKKRGASGRKIDGGLKPTIHAQHRCVRKERKETAHCWGREVVKRRALGGGQLFQSRGLAKKKEGTTSMQNPKRVMMSVMLRGGKTWPQVNRRRGKSNLQSSTGHSLTREGKGNRNLRRRGKKGQEDSSPD